MIGVTPHLGEEPLLPIPNAKHNIVDVDRGAILIKLAKAHDAVTKPRNVIKMLDVVVRSSKEHLRARLFEVHALWVQQEHANICHKKCRLFVFPINLGEVCMRLLGLAAILCPMPKATAVEAPLLVVIIASILGVRCAYASCAHQRRPPPLALGGLEFPSPSRLFFIRASHCSSVK